MTRLVILNYHGLIPERLPVPDWCFLEIDRFREQMRVLAASVEVLSLEEAWQRVRTGSAQGTVCSITFDDGLRGALDLALPVLEELQLPATLFLPTSFVFSGEPLWYLRLLAALTATRKREIRWKGTSHGLSGPEERSRASKRFQALLKELPAPRLEDELRHIERLLGVDQETIPGHTAFEPIRPDQIARLQTSELIAFGAHSRTHRILSKLTDGDLRDEIEGSFDDFERLTGRRCTAFAYPNGLAADYDGRALRLLRDLGADLAVTAEPGANDSRTPHLELKRFSIGAETDGKRLRQLLEAGA